MRACAAVRAWRGRALVNINLAVLADVTVYTVAAVRVHRVRACAAVRAWRGRALVDVHTAQRPVVARHAHAGGGAFALDARCTVRAGVGSAATPEPISTAGAA